jgi:hypothetical protein
MEMDAEREIGLPDHQAFAHVAITQAFAERQWPRAA